MPPSCLTDVDATWAALASLKWVLNLKLNSDFNNYKACKIIIDNTYA